MIYCVLVLIALARVCAGAAGEVTLPNPGFEEVGADGLPTGWQGYNWGPEGTAGDAVCSEDTPRSGAHCLRATSHDGAARPGVYTHVWLEPGLYRLRFWARAAQVGGDGRPNTLVRAYVADRYSAPMLVGGEWSELVFEHTVANRRLRAEINLQNFGGEAGTVWFDDVRLEALPAQRLEVTADDRPAERQPRLLYFCGHIAHGRRSAAAWAARGFAGFFFGGLLEDWTTDVWAQDGEPASTGPDDRLLQEAAAAVSEMRVAGLAESVLKVALYTKLPDPFRGGEYARLGENFRQGAQFAKQAGFTMLAIDTEYVAEQYEYTWPGYDYREYTRQELAKQLRRRWREVGEVLAESCPGVQVAVLPEGAMYYGPLWCELFGGLLEGLEAGKGLGKVHLFCEGTYDLTEPAEIKEHAEAVRLTTEARLSGRARELWRERGRLALGTWPLGYYREIKSADGKFLGWSGKEATFGDRIVGSYADKSERYPFEAFRRQLAAIRTFSDDYCWVYGHGSTWWQVTPEEADILAGSLHRFPRENYLLPVVSNIEDYYRATAEGLMVRVR